MRDELVGRFVFVGTQPGTVTEVTTKTLKVKLHNVPNKMRSENVVVEVEKNSSEWRLKYPGEKRA